MIRKDVKLGFAIGGVLLAVLAVYVLVGTGGNKDGNGAGIVTEDPGAGVTVKPATPDSSTPDKTSHPAADEAPVAAANDVNRAAPGSSAAGSSSGSSAAAAKDANHDLWDSTLNHGELMLTQTPAPTRAAAAADRPDEIASPRAVSDAPTTRPISLSIVSDTLATAGPATQPIGARTHVVQRGETLARISHAAYGSPNYYPHILRANPGLVAEKLKPGMVINLPPVSEVKPTDAASVSHGGVFTQSIDPKSQYQVESGDSLYKIAVKLYGKAELADKIYDLNKETIGPDRAKLKLHLVLKLPEAPTAN